MQETVELLMPYIENPEFAPKVARMATVAAEGLCAWVHAMVLYHNASAVIKPKLERLVLAEARMEEARVALANAELRLQACHARMAELRRAFDDQVCAALHAWTRVSMPLRRCSCDCLDALCSYR